MRGRHIGSPEVLEILNDHNAKIRKFASIPIELEDKCEGGTGSTKRKRRLPREIMHNQTVS